MTGWQFTIAVGISYGILCPAVGTASDISKLQAIVLKFGCTQIILFKREDSHYNFGKVRNEYT